MMLPIENGLEVFVFGGDDIPADRFGSRQKCPNCERRFATRSGMISHIERYHEKEPKA